MLNKVLPQELSCLLIMLLDDLVETGVVELSEECKIVYIGDDDSKTFF